MYFSVVIPTYNRRRLLAEAVESVMAQTFDDFEIVIVDDASTDDTASYVEDLVAAESCIRAVNNDSNRGVSYSRNRGIELARGPVMCFLDSDDLWKPEKLNRQYDFLEANPNIQVVHTHEIWLRNGKLLNQKAKHRKQGGYFFERSLEACLISPSSVAIRAPVFDEVGAFDEDLQVCEDYDLWLRLNLRYEIGYLPDPLVTKRGGHADQLSHSVDVIDEYRVQSLQKILATCPLSVRQKKQVAASIVRKADIIVKGSLKRGQYERANYFNSILKQYS